MTMTMTMMMMMMITIISFPDCSTDMVKLLLKHNIIVGDALMHAIQVESADAVEIICAHFAQELPEDQVVSTLSL